MDVETREGLLARYRSAAQLLGQSVAGASIAQLDGAPPEPGWTAREIVHHTADVAIMGALRLRLMLVGVTLEYWDIRHEEVAGRLGYDQLPIGHALSLTSELVETSANLLERLTEEAWMAPRLLPDGARYSAADWLRANTRHIEEHTDQIRYALTGTC